CLPRLNEGPVLLARHRRGAVPRFVGDVQLRRESDVSRCARRGHIYLCSTAETTAMVWSTTRRNRMSEKTSRVTRAAGAIAVATMFATGVTACDRPNSGAEAIGTTASSLNTMFVNDFFGDGNGWDQPQYYLTLQYPDVNGDLRSDVCGRHNDGIWCSTDDGTTQQFNQTLWSNNFTDGFGWAGASYYPTIKFPDVTGDGKADVCGRGNAGVLCGISSGSGFGTVNTWASVFSDANGWTLP